MKKWMKRIVVSVLVLLLLAVAGVSGFALSRGYPPAPRPELVTPLPEGVPPAPRGWPTEYASYAAGFTLYDIVPWENAPSVDGVTEKLDIQYGTGGGQPLYLDLYLPAEITGTMPGLVLYYGGGWKKGRKDQLRVYAQKFAKEGYVVACAQYRLRDAGRWPNAIHDAKCAVRWMRAHAEENHLDPGRIGVMGNSAGAYLALMVGYTPGTEEFEGDGGWAEYSSAAQAVADIYGPADFTEPVRRNHPLILSFMNGPYETDPSRYERASPIRYVNAQTPPTCVIHGTVDMLVPVHQSDWLVEKLAAEGVPHCYSRIDGWPHACDFVDEVHNHTSALILHFFNEHLKNRAPSAQVAAAETQADAAAAQVQ
jgi:acetyl esterase/lipase